MTKRPAKSKKTVTFAAKPSTAALKTGDSVDSWVKAGTTPEATGTMKRLTIDMPAPLHTRIKTQCAQHGLVMAEVIRQFLEQRFPET